MATNDQIFTVRLSIDDPSGFIEFAEAANGSALPAAPSQQTCYKRLDNGRYVATEKESGAVESDYETQDLRVSDAQLSAWINKGGLIYAECQALKQIIAKLAKELEIKKMNAGAEDMEWQSLDSLLKIYKDQLDRCEKEIKSENNNNTGKWGRTKQPITGGGNY
jgi:hypothetical protein